jgi:type II secretory ATPase GspE/PulE/Tfp pilus assembly ATPase PilB-like protein
MAACGVGDEELARLVAMWFRVDVADLTAGDPSVIRLIPGPVARRFGVFPLEDLDRRLAVATADPCDVQAEQHIGFASGRTPLLRIAPPDRIMEAIEATYSTEHAVGDVLNRPDRPSRDPRVKIISEEPAPQEQAPPDESGDAGPIVKLTSMILEDAVTKAASDIHLQPHPTGGVIRLRIDGVLRSGITVPLPVLARVISRIKILSRLDISDKMRPQDGRAQIHIGGRKYDLRISTVPVRGGEKAVIRILDPQGSGALDESGLPAREVQRLRKVLRNRDGILVVTGPTGSGKTTTMYAALREIATEDVNIMTVEDPVEYELPGLTQIQVDPKQGVTFQSALKAILRQDPDVIFVGEIRDGPTAETAAQASLTGHLVLATVHANDAVGSVRRFLDLGLDAGTIAETLRGALAQRLLRTLCTDCAQPVEDPLQASEAALAARYGTRPTMRAVGCEECGMSGYRGRRPVAELILPTTELLHLVSQEASHLDMMTQARADGMRSLLEGALDLVSEGLTTLAEVERVIGEESSSSARSAAVQAASEATGAAASLAALAALEEGPSEPVATPAPVPAPAESPRTTAQRQAAHSLAPPFLPPGSVAAAAAAPPAPPPTPLPTPPPTPSLIPGGTRHDAVEGEPKVLVVDDDADMRLLCRTLLEGHGWQVTEAANGATALLTIGKEPDLSLIVLDLGLPDIDGIDVLRGARSTLQMAHIPVIVLSGRTDQESELLAIQEGADDYIRKPLDPPIFLTRSKAAWRRSRGL